MEFTRDELKIVSAALMSQADELRAMGKETQFWQAQKSESLMRRIDNHLLDTALPATPAVNRDGDEIWA